jgi:outer membrane protein assembly factor BamA
LKIKYFLLFCFFQLFHIVLWSQVDGGSKNAIVKDTIPHDDPDNSSNRDLIDYIHHLSNKHNHPHAYTPTVKNEKYHLSLVPAVGYTLQTGFAGIVSANIAYFTDVTSNAKISSITTSITYSQYSQTIIPLILDIWTKDNKFNIISDNRFIEYPSSIYGLGGRIDPNKGHTIDFTGLKFHQTVLKAIAKNVYAGIGFYYDKFWNIQVLDSITRRIDLLINRELGNTEIASGYTLRFLYDNRINQINSKNGWYFNTVFRDNRTFLGSDNNWQSLLIDTRKYITFSGRAKNTLAFWSLDWLTLKGTPPYLLLPSTGWDDQYNTGRGYIQGRFRGNNMFYFETEYRYKISRNGLLGGVLFGNLQHFSGELSDQYTHLLPGYGAGIRIKLNKHSGANLCIDYAFGQNGSNGVFVNLGEVF